MYYTIATINPELNTERVIYQSLSKYAIVKKVSGYLKRLRLKDEDITIHSISDTNHISSYTHPITGAIGFLVVSKI